MDSRGTKQPDPQVPPRVTVVIVTFQSSATIEKALEPLREPWRQGLLRCVVVDNASTDGTVDLLRRETDWIELDESRENLGYGRGCNLGWPSSQTPYVLFLNPDAVLEAAAIEILLEFMDEHPRAGIVAPALLGAGERPHPVGSLTTPERIIRRALRLRVEARTPVEAGGAPIRTDWLSGAVQLVRTELLRELEGFDPRFFLYFEETDMGIRALERGWELWVVPAAIGHHAVAVSAQASGKPMMNNAISEHFYRSRFYYLVKHHGWVSAVTAEFLDVIMAGLRVLVLALIRRDPSRPLARLRAPAFRLPARPRPGGASEAAVASSRGAREQGAGGTAGGRGMNAPEPGFPIRRMHRPSFRRRLLHGLEAGLYWSGAAALYAKASRARGATVLMYHSVPDAQIQRWVDPRGAVPLEVFEAQMDFLARRRKVVSMSDLVGTLESGDSPEPGTVVISFDDGYRDTLELAAPVLERHGFPAIVYLATGYVTRAENQWVNQLHAAFRFRTKHRLCFDGPGSRSFELDGDEAVLDAYTAIAGRLLVADWDERTELLGRVREQLHPREEAPRLTLTWPEVEELIRRYPRFELGVHTRDHIDLTAHSEEIARAEIEASVADLAREVNVEVEHFSFPYGRSNDRVRAIVAEASLRSAVVTEPASPIRCDADRFAMPRIEVTQAMTRLRFRTSGAYPDLPLALLGRA